MKRIIKYFLVIIFLVGCKSSFNNNQNLKTKYVDGYIKNNHFIITQSRQLGEAQVNINVQEGRRNLKVTVYIEDNNVPVPNMEFYEIKEITDSIFTIQLHGNSNKNGEILIPKKRLKNGILLHSLGFRSKLIYLIN